MKKKKKQLFAAILSVVMALSVMPTAMAEYVGQIASRYVLEPTNTGYYISELVSSESEALVVREYTYHGATYDSAAYAVLPTGTKSAVYKDFLSWGDAGKMLLFLADNGDYVVISAEDGSVQGTFSSSEYSPAYLMKETPYALLTPPGRRSVVVDFSGHSGSIPNGFCGFVGSPMPLAVSGGYSYFCLNVNDSSLFDGMESAFDGVYSYAGPFSEGYALVQTVGTTGGSDGVSHKDIDASEITTQKSGTNLTFSMTDPELKDSYPCYQNGVEASVSEHQWSIVFTSGEQTYMISVYSPVTTGSDTPATLTLEEMRKTLYRKTSDTHFEAISGVDVSLSVKEKEISLTFDSTQLPNEYAFDTDDYLVNNGNIMHTSPSTGGGTTTVTDAVYQLINANGAATFSDIDKKYTDWKYYREGVIPVCDRAGNWGYINASGEEVIPCKYSSASIFRNGFAVVSDYIYGKGVIDKDGNEVVKFGLFNRFSAAASTGMIWAVDGSHNVYSINLRESNYVDPPAAVRYVPYSLNVVSSAVYDITLTSGNLPDGISVGEFGVVGTPTETGSFPVNLTIMPEETDESTWYGMAFTLTVKDSTEENVDEASDSEYVITDEVNDMRRYVDQVFEIERKDGEENFDDFSDFYLDGQKLIGGKIGRGSEYEYHWAEDVPDEWQYYAERGSTRITVRAQTFKDAGSGTHTIAATFVETKTDESGNEVKETKSVAQQYTVSERADAQDDPRPSRPSYRDDTPTTRPTPSTTTTKGSDNQNAFKIAGTTATFGNISASQLVTEGALQNGVLSFNMVKDGQTVNAVEFPSGLIEQLSQMLSYEGSFDRVAFVLTSGTIEMDSETLLSIAEQANGASVKLSLDEVSADALSAEQRGAIEGMDVEKIISVEIFAGGKEVTSFGGGRVTLRIPFAVPQGKVPRGYAAWHLTEDGRKNRHSSNCAADMISFRSAHFSYYAIAYEEPNLFADVPDDAWYTSEVDHIAYLGVMTGTTANQFAPNAVLTRAMLAQLLYNAENGSAVESAGYVDVPENVWYTDAINWAASNRIMNGSGAKFDPEKPVTREQLVTVLYNYAIYKNYDVSKAASLNRFTDGDKTAGWAQSSMCWAVANKLIEGVSSKTLMPQGVATRAQIAKVLTYFFESFEK